MLEHCKVNIQKIGNYLQILLLKRRDYFKSTSILTKSIYPYLFIYLSKCFVYGRHYGVKSVRTTPLFCTEYL